jgi:hypothetical protein
MHEIESASALSALISSSYPDAQSGVIAIDGIDGVGKTTLAKNLQAFIGGTLVSLDTFLAAALASSTRPTIVEGVCLCAAMEAVSVEPDLLVYVKCVAEDGYWHDEDTCDPKEGEDALICRLSRDAKRFAELDARLSGEPVSGNGAYGLSPLVEEIIRYHCKYRPSRRAQIVYLRRDAAV